MYRVTTVEGDGVYSFFHTRFQSKSLYECRKFVKSRQQHYSPHVRDEAKSYYIFDKAERQYI
jgi:hypothetical protein